MQPMLLTPHYFGRKPVIGLLTGQYDTLEPQIDSTQLFIETLKHSGLPYKVFNVDDVILQTDSTGVKVHFKDGDTVLPDTIISSLAGEEQLFTGVKILKAFQLLNKPLSSSPEAILNCDDKFNTHLELAQAGIPQPSTLYASKPLSKHFDLIALWKDVKVVLKGLFGNQGKQVSFPLKRQGVKSVHHKALLQEFMPTGERATDFRYYVVNGKIAATIQRKSTEPGKLTANVSSSQGYGEWQQIEPDEVESQMAIKTAEQLGMLYAAVDILRTPEGSMVCEVNSQPGITHIKRTNNVNIAERVIEAMWDKAHEQNPEEIDKRPA